MYEVNLIYQYTFAETVYRYEYADSVDIFLVNTGRKRNGDYIVTGPDGSLISAHFAAIIWSDGSIT